MRAIICRYLISEDKQKDMAEIIKARVWQKVDTLENWMANPLILGTGEFALVLTAPGGTVFNFKVGVGNKRFSELEWSLQTPGTAIEANTSTVFPPETPGLYIPTESGAYDAGIDIDLSDGYQQIIWDGSNATKVVIPITFDPNKDQLLYPNSSSPNIGSYINNGVIFITKNTLDKWTGLMPIDNNYPIVIEGHTSVFITQFSFFDENKSYISSYTLSASNGTIPKSSIPFNARFGAKNLSRSNGGNDDSNVVMVYAKESIYDALARRSVVNEIETVYSTSNDIQHKIGINKVNLIQQSYDGSLILGNDGTTTINNNYSRTKFINIRGANQIIIGNIPFGLPPSRWFYDDNFEPISKVELLNGIISEEEIPINAHYIAFSTRYMGVEIDSTSYMWIYRTPSVDGIDFLRNETHVIYKPGDQVLSEEIRANGTINTSPDDPNTAWSGYRTIIQGMDILISGVPYGLNTKAFYSFDKSVLGTLLINNGVIKWDDIPSGASFIGFNVKTPSTGDGTMSAMASSIIRADGEEESFVDDFIAIPSIIPVVVGIQANIYTDNVRSNPVNDPTEVFSWSGASLPRNGTDPYVYNFRQTERSLQYQPTSGGQTVQMTASLRDRNYRVIAERKFAFTSVPANAGNGQRKVILLAGDSQINPTYDGAKTSFAPFMKDMFDQEGYADMVFVGQEPMVETVYYDANPANNRVVSCPTEGYGGRQINWFYESTSPFWNPAISDVDMVDYLDRMRNISGNPFGLQVGDTLDYFIFPMGVNDYAQGLTTEAIIERMKIMQEKVWAGFPNCMFIIGMVTQGSKFWSMDLRRRWNIEYYNALIREFETPAYDGKVFLSAAGLWTDNIYGSRQIRPLVEPYKRIVDSKTLLIQKLIQTQGLTQQQAEDKVNNDWGFLVEERVMERWTEEFPGTTDIVHSAWVSAMQQADCYYSTIKYLLQ